MPFALFWYILRDLLKVLILSTIVLVTIISFGAAIKPLSEGVLGPLALMKFILLAMPPMLQFALPFSAAFSATLVYHRMTSDNEVVACAANGVAFSQLFLPAAALGVALTIGLSFLANHASPYFWEAMARAVRIDGAELITRSVERGEPIRTRGFWVYADEAEQLEPPEGVEADTVLWLRGLIVAHVKQGRLTRDGTAREGYFYLTRRDRSTILTCSIIDPTYHDIETGARMSAQGVDSQEYVIPDKQLDQPKFMPISRLREIAADKESYWRIAEQVDDLRRWVARRQMANEIDAVLRRDHQVEFQFSRPGPRAGEVIRESFRLYGRGLEIKSDEAWRLFPRAGESACRIVKFDGEGRPAIEITSRDVLLKPEIRVLLAEPTVRLQMKDATIRELSHSQPITNVHPQFELSDLRWSSPIMDSIRPMNIESLVAKARTMADETTLRPMFVRINDEYARLEAEVLSRLHERTALPVSCLVMMLLGAALAVAMRSALPMTIYFWSFMPAIVGLLLVSAGSDIVQDPSVNKVYGLSVMWSGNIGMGLLTLVVFRYLMRR